MHADIQVSRGPRRPRLAWLAGIAALAFALPAAAGSGVIKYKDKNGVTHYTNVPGDRGANASPATAITTNAPAPKSSTASVFKYRDAAGVLHYTDRKPKNQRYTVLSIYCPACDPKSTVNWDRTRLNLTAYATEINTAAQLNGVDPALVRALIHAESAFNPDARSRKGAQGLMQLMPATASMYGVSNAYDAVQNINAGVQHLAGLLKNFKGDVRLVTAAYNAGEGAVRKYGGVPPYDETRVYVERVGVLHKRYQTGT